MATIAPYLSQGIHAGQQVTLKIHEFRWRTVGHGTASALSDFELKIDGRVELVHRQSLFDGFANVLVPMHFGSATGKRGRQFKIGGTLAIYKGELKIHVVLLDQDAAAKSGPCSLQMNSLADDKASYRADGSGVTIATVMDGTDVQVQVSRSGKDNMTECKVSGPFNLTAYIEPSAS